jgi:hypothetical protein
MILSYRIVAPTNTKGYTLVPDAVTSIINVGGALVPDGNTDRYYCGPLVPIDIINKY